MSRANDPAYPEFKERLVRLGVRRIESYGGLTIREHFAGLAMQALIGTAAAPCLTDCLGGAESHCAAGAVKMADALIVELAKPAKEKPDAAADVENYLVERVEWLNREIKNGGNRVYLTDKVSETEYILKTVREIRARTK